MILAPEYNMPTWAVASSKLCGTFLTSVSGARTNVYFFMISMRAILASMRANLIPMQLRGPQPKGMWQIAGRFAFSSGVNLRKEGREEGIGGTPREGSKEAEREGWRAAPFWVKFLWFGPVLWVVMEE